MGDKGFLDIECKKAAAAGTIAGPRLLVATRGIRAPNGHGYVGYPFSGVETIRQAVRENLSAGADLIKIYTTGTVKSPKGLPHYFSLEEVQTLVDEAHRAGVPVATHCIGGPGLTMALKAGVDVIEHGYFASDEGKPGPMAGDDPQHFLYGRTHQNSPPDFNSAPPPTA
jgi:imidazolonepropionase-like amidohydrolase